MRPAHEVLVRASNGSGLVEELSGGERISGADPAGDISGDRDGGEEDEEGGCEHADQPHRDEQPIRLAVYHVVCG